MVELPTQKRPASEKGPHMMLVYSAPKAGKTTIVSLLENSLLIECEPHGADYVDAVVIEASKPKEFNEIIDALVEQGKPYKYVIVDTVTKLDEWSEIVGTYGYMNKPQGKKFNLKDERRPDGGKFTHTDKEFQTVHELGQGYGYRYSRNVMIDWYNRLSEVAEHVILLAHIKDKYIESRQGDTVETKDISLTGKVKESFTTRVDAVAHFYRKGNEGILNFANEHNQAIGIGGRCKHLTGEITISEKQEDGTIKGFWDKIYPENK